MQRNIKVRSQLSFEPSNITYGIVSTAFGQVFLAISNKTNASTDKTNGMICVCRIHFIQQQQQQLLGNDEIRERSVKNMQEHWPNCNYQHDDQLVNDIAAQIFHTQNIGNKKNDGDGSEKPITIYVGLHGTEFQKNVWKILIDRTEPGMICTYTQVAEWMGKPNAVRAVANAIGKNDIAILVPCHRVLSKASLAQSKIKYRWGGNIKQQLIEYEAAN